MPVGGSAPSTSVASSQNDAFFDATDARWGGGAKAGDTTGESTWKALEAIRNYIVNVRDPGNGYTGAALNNNSMQVVFYAAAGDELLLGNIVKEWYATFGPNMQPLVWLGRKMIKFSNISARLNTNDMDAPGGSEGQSVTLIQRVIEFLVISSPKS